MSDYHHARGIMEYLSLCELKTNHGVTLQSIMHYCGSHGMSYEDVQAGLIAASHRGWVTLVDDQYVHLTEAGYVVINVANDNPPN
jgi:hypothetical protein